MPKPPKVKVNETNKYHKKFHDELQKLKEKHGSGVYFLGRRMTRRVARTVARKLARRKLKEAKQHVQSSN